MALADHANVRVTRSRLRHAPNKCQPYRTSRHHAHGDPWDHDATMSIDDADPTKAKRFGGLHRRGGNKFTPGVVQPE